MVDISEEIIVIHQSHHYNFHNPKNNPNIFDRNKIPLEEDGKKNMELHGDKVLNLLDADFSIANGKIVKKRSKIYLQEFRKSYQLFFMNFHYFLLFMQNYIGCFCIKVYDLINIFFDF